MSDAVRQAVLAALGSVAPEADLDELEADEPLREQIDLDSMDFLKFVVKLSEDLGVSVPERDFPKLESLDDAVEYLVATGAGE